MMSSVKIDSNVMDAPTVQVDSTGILLVCLCDLTDDGYTFAEPLGRVQLCDRHGFTNVKLQSLIDNDLKCCLYAIDQAGDVMPLHVKES